MLKKATKLTPSCLLMFPWSYLWKISLSKLSTTIGLRKISFIEKFQGHILWDNAFLRELTFFDHLLNMGRKVWKKYTKFRQVYSQKISIRLTIEFLTPLLPSSFRPLKRISVPWQTNLGCVASGKQNDWTICLHDTNETLTLFWSIDLLQWVTIQRCS